jgi:hypothetical protein
MQSLLLDSKLIFIIRGSCAWELRLREKEGQNGAGGMPRRISIKVGTIMRSRRNQGQRLSARNHKRNLIDIDGASCLFMPSAMVRDHAQLWEENG